MVFQFDTRLPLQQVSDTRDAKARWRLHRYHWLGQWYLRKNNWLAPRTRSLKNDSSGPKANSRRPLPSKRHHQNLVFPRNYTHGFGPGFQTLTACPAIHYTAPPEHLCFQELTPLAPGCRSCFRCLPRFQPLGPVVSNRGHHPPGSAGTNQVPWVCKVGAPCMSS